MSSRTARNLIARTPDGTRITLRTSGGYDLAGLVHRPSGWYLVAKGSSQDSVTSRTRSAMYRTGGDNWIVAPLQEEVPEVIESYAPLGGTRVAGVFSPATGWKDAKGLSLSRHPGKSFIRSLKRAGWTAVSVSVFGHNASADFQMDELLPRRQACPLGGAR